MSYEIVSQEPDQIHVRFPNDERERAIALTETGVKFFRSLPENDRDRIYFQEFDTNYSFSHETSGAFRLYEKSTETPTDWSIQLGKLSKKMEEEDKEAKKENMLDSIPSMADHELAAYLREFTGCGKALNEALARLLEGRVSPSTR